MQTRRPRDRPGVLWIGTRGGGLVRYETGTFDKFVIGPDRQSNNIRSICESVDGAIWISTKNGLHRLYDNKITRIEISEENELLDVRSVCEDSNGDFWIGTIAGVIILSKTEGRYVPTRKFLKNKVWTSIAPT